MTKRYGFERKGGAHLLNHHSISKKLPPVEHQFLILKALNIEPASDHLEFWIKNTDQEKGDQLLCDLGIAKNAPLVGLNIGASWETKRWRADHIASFCQHILETYRKQVILTGDHKDKAFEAEIMKQTRVGI